MFGAVGSLISGSGFEDIIHQSGLCSLRSLNGVISASHYIIDAGKSILRGIGEAHS